MCSLDVSLSIDLRPGLDTQRSTINALKIFNSFNLNSHFLDGSTSISIFFCIARDVTREIEERERDEQERDRERRTIESERMIEMSKNN